MRRIWLAAAVLACAIPMGAHAAAINPTTKCVEMTATKEKPEAA